MVKKKKKKKKDIKLRVITDEEILGKTSKEGLKRIRERNEQLKKEKLFFK